MRTAPHTRAVVKEADIDHLLARFEEEYRNSLIRKKFTLDTSDATIEQTLAEFAAQIKKHLSQADRLRVLAHQAWPST